MTSRLQRVLKKQRPFDQPGHEAYLNLLREDDPFQNRFGKLFREFDVTSSQYNVLRSCGAKGSLCLAR